jgi:hypothetical protein
VSRYGPWQVTDGAEPASRWRNRLARGGSQSNESPPCRCALVSAVALLAVGAERVYAIHPRGARRKAEDALQLGRDDQRARLGTEALSAFVEINRDALLGKPICGERSRLGCANDDDGRVIGIVQGRWSIRFGKGVYKGRRAAGKQPPITTRGSSISLMQRWAREPYPRGSLSVRATNATVPQTKLAPLYAALSRT